MDRRYPAFFHTDHSSSAIPVTTPQIPTMSLWDLSHEDHTFVDTPEFYQKLIGMDPQMERDVGVQIATGIELETLITCSDGSFDPQTKKGSNGWVLSDTNKRILAQGSGPADGHPALMSSYRAELGGLIAILYTIYRICQFQQVSSGKFKYHCDNKGVLTNVFSNKPMTISQFLHADYDLVHVAKTLVAIIPATIVAEWVKGHYNGECREHKHDLNERADKLAANFNANPPIALKQMKQPCPLPGYAIRLLYDVSTITNKLYRTMSKALHGKIFYILP
jgi:ribonuclease HI